MITYQIYHFIWFVLLAIELFIDLSSIRGNNDMKACKEATAILFDIRYHAIAIQEWWIPSIAFFKYQQCSLSLPAAKYLDEFRVIDTYPPAVHGQQQFLINTFWNIRLNISLILDQHLYGFWVFTVILGRIVVIRWTALFAKKENIHT